MAKLHVAQLIFETSQFYKKSIFDI